MVEALALTILASGFLVISKHPYHAFRLYRYAGEFLHVRLLKAGVYTLLIASLGNLVVARFLVVDSIICSQLHWLWKPPISEVETGPLWFPGGPVCILLAWLWSSAAQSLFFIEDKYWIKKQQDSVLSIALMSELLNEGSMDKLFFYSIVDKTPVLLTLVSGKVYIGILCRLGEPNEKDAPNQEFSLLPILSGYQTPEGKPILTTSYFCGQQSSTSSSRYDSHRIVVLPRHAIVSAEHLMP